MRTAASYVAATAVGIVLVLPTTVLAVPETTVSFTMGDLKFSTEQGYDLVEASGCHLAGEPGHPLLPCRAVNFVIPRDKAVASVKFEAGPKQKLPGSFYVYPAQANGFVGGGGESVPPDPGIYESADPYPCNAVGQGWDMTAWGWSTYHVNVWPLEYIPAERELWLYSSVDIFF